MTTEVIRREQFFPIDFGSLIEQVAGIYNKHENEHIRMALMKRAYTTFVLQALETTDAKHLMNTFTSLVDTVRFESVEQVVEDYTKMKKNLAMDHNTGNLVMPSAYDSARWAILITLRQLAVQEPADSKEEVDYSGKSLCKEGFVSLCMVMAQHADKLEAQHIKKQRIREKYPYSSALKPISYTEPLVA